MRIGDHIDRSSDDWEKHPTGTSEEFCFRGLGSNTRRGVEEGKDGGKACHRCREGFSYLWLGCGWEVPRRARSIPRWLVWTTAYSSKDCLFNAVLRRSRVIITNHPMGKDSGRGRRLNYRDMGRVFGALIHGLFYHHPTRSSNAFGKGLIKIGSSIMVGSSPTYTNIRALPPRRRLKMVCKQPIFLV